MKRNLLWLCLVGVFVVLVVTGLLFGPQMYIRYFTPATPMGRLTGYRTVDSFRKVQADAGHRLWVVTFVQEPNESPPTSEMAKELVSKTFLVDNQGEQNAGRAWILVGLKISEEGMSPVTELVFSMPQGREPRLIRFRDGSSVRLSF